MDSIQKIAISNACDCNINVCLHNTDNNGVKSVMQDIATIIAASVANGNVFRNHKVDSVFVIGNIFILPQDSSIYMAYINILQEIFEISVKMKEK
jgi:hypothetical protein